MAPNAAFLYVTAAAACIVALFWSDLLPSEHALQKGGTTWVEEMNIRLRKVKRRRNGEIDTSTYLHAMEAIPDVYDMLLSLRVVSSAMRHDVNGHAANVRRSSERFAGGDTLQGIVRYGIRHYDRETLARNPASVVGGVLWLNRATTFIAAFIRGLYEGKESNRAASEAYNGLKIYHRPLTSAFVSRATSLCPKRDLILERMFPDEATAKSQLKTFLGLMEPLTRDIRSSLEAMGANYPDRVG